MVELIVNSKNKKRPLKVLFFHIMKENFSGAQKNIFRLLINLDKNTIDPILIGQMDTELTALCRKENITVNIVPFPSGLEVYDGGLLQFKIKTLYKFIISLCVYNKALYKNFEHNKPDVVWADNIRTFFTVFVACKLKRVKIIWNIWSEPQGKVAWVVHRLGLLLADKINLEYSNQGLKLFGSLSQRKLFREKITPLYTGVSDFEIVRGTEIRKELSLAADSLIVIMASNIVVGKGQLDLITCMAEIKKDPLDVHLLICGAPVESNLASVKYFENLKEFVENNDLEDSVHFLGWRSDIRDLYQQGNLYISTSYSESFPDAVREAMLASLPVIVTDVGGTNELVEDGGNGYLFEPGDLNHLTNCMIILLQNRELREQMGKKGEFIIETKFSTQVYARDFENMVAQLSR
jgi:glycosyltransferase involved in cell wall biosynthesis